MQCGMGQRFSGEGVPVLDGCETYLMIRLKRCAVGNRLSNPVTLAASAKRRVLWIPARLLQFNRILRRRRRKTRHDRLAEPRTGSDPKQGLDILARAWSRDIWTP